MDYTTLLQQLMAQPMSVSLPQAQPLPQMNGPGVGQVAQGMPQLPAQGVGFGQRMAAMGYHSMDPNAGLTAYQPIQSHAREFLQNYLGML